MEDAFVAMAVSGDAAEQIDMMGTVRVVRSVLMETEIRDRSAFRAVSADGD